MDGVAVRIPEPAVRDLLPLPHLVWGEDLGEGRAAALAGGTRTLILRFRSLRSGSLDDRSAAEAHVRRHADLVGETFEYLAGASDATRAGLVEWTERMYVALDRHGEHAPRTDPFRGLEEAAEPPSHLGPTLAPAWPFLMGELVAAAEEDLGWRRRLRRVDLRTWAALVGLSYLWSRRSFAAARPALRELLEATGTAELNRDGLLAGGALLANQRAVVAGYLGTRRRR